jgi:hypothetical protein
MAIYRQPSGKTVNAEPLGACRALYFAKRMMRHRIWNVERHEQVEKSLQS